MRASILYRWLLATLGVLFVALAGIGVALPGVPTTIFLILASWCFVRSSPRLQRWLLGNRFFAPYMRLIGGHQPLPLRTRIVALALMWACIVVSVVVLQAGVLVSGAIVLAGGVGSVAILLWRPAVADAAAGA